MGSERGLEGLIHNYFIQMNTLEQTNDIVNEIGLFQKKNNGTVTLILYNGQRLENIKVKHINVQESDPEKAVVTLEYFTTDANQYSIQDLFQVKAVQ
jgi:hypothetical protein